MGKKLCRYVLKMNRSSDIEGVFVITDEEFKAIKEIKGTEIYYGEIAGKHSEVSACLDAEDIEIISDKKKEVALFERLFPFGTGFEFLPYWFNAERASDEGFEAGGMKYESAEEALKEFHWHNNSVMKDSFIEGFNKARS